MAALYADEDFPIDVVVHLRRLGHDVLTAREALKAGQKIPDAAVLAFATTLGRAVLTRNRWDFHRLHRQVAGHAGIVTCSNDRDAAGVADRIHRVLTACPILTGLLVKITRPAKP